MIVQNGEFLREIADTVGHDMFGNDDEEDEEEGEDSEQEAAVAKVEKHPYDDDSEEEGLQSLFSIHSRNKQVLTTSSHLITDLEAYYDDLDSSNPGPPNHHAHSHDTPSHSHGSHSHSSPAPPPSAPDGASKPAPRPTDHEMDKLRSTLKQFVRDWSAEVSFTFIYLYILSGSFLITRNHDYRERPSGIRSTDPCSMLSPNITRMCPRTSEVR